MKEQVRRLVPRNVRRYLRSVRRGMGRTNMQKLLLAVEERGFVLGHARALEVFGAGGESHTLDYSSRVRTQEIWEIKPEFEPVLVRSFPHARVRIVDSIKEMRFTTSIFDLIVIDNPACVFGNYCENFDLFPAVFERLSDSSLLILNILPSLLWPGRLELPGADTHIARRRAFYGVEDSRQIPESVLIKTYVELGRREGFETEWSVVQSRGEVAYLALKVQRRRGHDGQRSTVLAGSEQSS